MCTTMELLQSTNRSASEMTKTLKSYGEGSQGQGLQKLYLTGIFGGVIIGFVLKDLKDKAFIVSKLAEDYREKKNDKQ